MLLNTKVIVHNCATFEIAISKEGVESERLAHWLTVEQDRM